MKKLLTALIFSLTGLSYAGDTGAIAQLPDLKLDPPAASKTIMPPAVVFRIKAAEAITDIQKGHLGALDWMVHP